MCVYKFVHAVGHKRREAHACYIYTVHKRGVEECARHNTRTQLYCICVCGCMFHSKDGKVTQDITVDGAGHDRRWAALLYYHPPWSKLILA